MCLGVPGRIVALPFAWSEDDAWKDGVMRADASGGSTGGETSDARTARHDVPQYQEERDRVLAERALAEGGCATCVFLT